MVYHKRGELINGFMCRQHPLYTTWANMKARCLNENCEAYPNYGGRGIGISDDWLHFENFANDMYPKPTIDHTLERIDNEKGYSSLNCKWATRQEQSENKRAYKTSKTGVSGVKQIPCGRFVVVVSIKGKRFKVPGSFETPEDAEKAKSVFLDNPDKTRKARYDSATGVRGITKTMMGYITRATDNGERIYLGHDKTIEKAIERLERWKQENS